MRTKNHFLKIITFILPLFSFNACVSFYDSLYLPDKNYLERRNLETRFFNTGKEKDVLIASAQVLQDMGYTIKESEVSVGLITAEKDRQAISTGAKVAINVLAAIGGTPARYEDIQRFYVTLVTSKSDKNKVKVRVLFTRKSWDNNGYLFAVERIDDPKVYREFFDKLSQSIFLIAQGI